jgi:Fe-S-cluster containining protein
MSPAEEQVIGMEYGGVPVHDEESLTCSALTPEGRCSIYEHRPLICRLYGVAEGLECHAGCVPAAGLLTRHQAKALLREMDAILDDGALR